MSEELPAEVPGDSQGKIIVFGAKQIRRIWHDDQWYFSIVDIIGALTDSDNPRNYWNMMKARELKQSEVQLSTLCVQLKLTSSDGESYKTDCVNVEAAIRIIQSIPSPKAEPFKRWLAEVGYQRVQEIENPNSASSGCGNSTSRKVTPTIGSKSAFVASPSVMNLPPNGRNVAFRSKQISPSSPPKSPKPHSV